MVTGRVLLVDDDPGLLRLLGLRLESFGHTVHTADSGSAALTALTRFHPQVVITDLRMDVLDGMQLLDEVHRLRPGVPVLMITAHGTIPDAVKATQLGAFCFLTKPVDKRRLKTEVEQALAVSAATDAVPMAAGPVVTRSAIMQELLDRARMIAQSAVSVLITGDSGTGKELIAQYIHDSSSRRDAEFVAINCGAIPHELLESELFGHEKGAFTGAAQRHTGLFEVADRGTLLLDEIGEMPVSLQVKLLRVLQEREIRPVGASQSIKVDVRVISATHRDLKQAIEHGDFREDLYYRLNVINLVLPPLSQRREDIPLLADHFLNHLAKRDATPVKRYTPDAIELLVKAAWPGNVRQLFNVIEQNVVLSPTRVINRHTVRAALDQPPTALPSLRVAREQFTRSYINELLAATNGNVSRAARLANRNRTDFHRLLNKLNIDPAGFKAR